MRVLLSTSVVAGVLMVSPVVWAAKPKHPAAPAVATSAAARPNRANPVVATVDGHPIYLADLDQAVQELPANMRNASAAQLYPVLLTQLVDREALVLAARKQGLQNDPAVQQAMARADEQVLQNALLRRDIAPQVTEANLRALYDKQIGTKPGEEEVRASHILVATEDQAKDVIKQLNAGADFATLAKKLSTDPSGKDTGGDLNWFKRGDMLPEFSTAAFALQKGQITQTPIKTRYGYHVIKLVDRRLSSPPTFTQAQQQLQQQFVQGLIQQEVAKAKQGLTVVQYNSDGSKPAAGAAPAVIAPPAPPQAAPPSAAPPSAAVPTAPVPPARK